MQRHKGAYGYFSGEHSGCVCVSFDWLEDLGASSECRINPYPVDWGDGEHRLTWDCEDCPGGSAPLEPYAGDEG